MGLPGAAARRLSGPCGKEPEAGARDDDRREQQHANSYQAPRRQHSTIRNGTRRYMTPSQARFRPAPRPPVLAAEPLRERLGDRGRAVRAADQRSGDGAMALAEDAVGDIAEEREAGDEHDHQPQLLRIPRAERSVMAVGKERQHRARDHRIARERLDVVLVELVEEAVELGLQRRSSVTTAAPAMPNPGSPNPAMKPRPTVVIAAIGRRRVGLRIRGRAGARSRSSSTAAKPATMRPGDERLLPSCPASPARPDARPSEVKVRTPATRVPARIRAGRSRARSRSAARMQAPSRRDSACQYQPRSRRRIAPRSTGRIAFEDLLLELRPLARIPQLAVCTTR